MLVSLLAEVGLDYVTYRSLQQRIALANQNVAAQQGTLDLTMDAPTSFPSNVVREASPPAELC